MSIKCKNCLSDNIFKSGNVQVRQRYECKDCATNFRVGDERQNILLTLN